MGAVVLLMTLIQAVTGLISLACFVMVLIKMFQNGATGIAIACIVLILLCGIGVLIAFIYGWMKSGEWNIGNIMLIWTICIVASLGLSVFTGAANIIAGGAAAPPV